MPLDLALQRNPATGKFDIVWDDFNDVTFDDLAVYPVLTTLATRKGSYYWDSTGQQGTHLYSVRKDAYATGSQLRAYAQDGLDQVKAQGAITGGTVTAERLRSGSWVVRPVWNVAGRSKPVTREIKT